MGEKTMRNSIIVLFTIILAVFSCRSTGNGMGENQFIIKMTKTPCYGKCPVYSIEIDKKGLTVLEGKKNLDKIGKFQLQLPESELKELIQTFVSSDFFQFQDEYISKKTDLSTTYITFQYDGKLKKIRDYDGAPIELKNLEKKVEMLLERTGWEKIN